MKRIMSLILVLVFVLSISVSAQVTHGKTDTTSNISKTAEKKLAKVESIVEKTNAKIEKAIDSAISKSERIVDKYNNDQFSEIEKDKKIDQLISKLIAKTNKISSKAKARCEKLGFTVECEWVEVEIDGSTVLIDPLYIVGD